jgi:hypothetical protein
MDNTSAPIAIERGFIASFLFYYIDITASPAPKIGNGLAVPQNI